MSALPNTAPARSQDAFPSDDRIGDSRRIDSNRPSKAHEFSELRLCSITRRFGSHQLVQAALDDLSITIRRGEFIALQGPSGCGKSTALNCVAGLLPLTSGSIWLDDHRIDTLPPENRGFGMVFQNYALFPHMSVRKNVGFGLMMRGVPESEIRSRVSRALSLVQLEGHEDKLPGQLSGGQQQRVAIARAIVVEPPLVLMDEPLSNLDAKLRIEMRAEIRRIHHELGRTTIYVTHDQDEALSLADRIVVMRQGRTQQIAPPHAVYTKPANLHVARFMGYRNVLSLEVVGSAGDKVNLRAGELTLTGTVTQSPTGSRVVAAIRPDEMALVSESAPNSITGKVMSVEYAGRYWLVEVALESGDALFVRSTTPVEAGDIVHVAAPPERILVYPAEDTVQ